MRSFVFLLVVASCLQGRATDDVRANDMGSNGAGGAPASCDLDADCALAASTCCACPSFAVRAGDNTFEASCKDVTCPMPEPCPSMVAVCVAHACAAACAPIACEASCGNGYALDAGGCLTCACQAIPANHCADDRDCTEVAADCCGCARGGSDTAVLAVDAAAYEAKLGCTRDANCPNTDACTPTATARCHQGSCALTTTTTLPLGACGRPDLASCPAGQICVLNASPDATALGVGICGMP